MRRLNCIAILPQYDASGANITLCIFEDGSKEIYNFPVKYFMNHLCDSFWLNPVSMNKWIHSILNTTKYRPVVLRSELIFLPFRMRHSISHHDGSIGYLRANAIVSHTGSQVTLITGEVIHTLASSSCIQNK